MRPDGVDRREASPLDRVADVAKREWPTVTSVAHGLMSVPGIAARAYADAAQTNATLGKAIDSTVTTWTQQSAAARSAAIDDLKAAARKTSSTASAVADSLEHANRLPLAVEKAASGANDVLHIAGSAANKAVDSAIASAPKALQAPLGAVARSLGSAVTNGYAATTHAAKSMYDHTVNTLPGDVEKTAGRAVTALETTATAQSQKATGALTKTSAFIGKTVGSFTEEGALRDGAIAKAVARTPGLSETPVFGLLITGAATGLDVAGGKSVADATVANVGSTLVGTAAGAAVTDGLTSVIGSAAIADVAADALGVAAVSGPVGWAVAGGVIAGAAVGYGVYRAVESKPGQDVIDGLTHLDSAKVEHGLQEAGDGIRSGFSAIGHLL
jgi:hypothetical protein